MMSEPASDPNVSVRAEATRHIKARRMVLPIAYRAKVPCDEQGLPLDKWQALRLTERDLPRYFNGEPRNLGILLGEPSAWLVDIDLDTAEARELAPRILPATACFGRTTSRRSHWLFVADGAVTTKYLEPDPTELTSQGKPKLHTLLELRSTGMQTVVPPSTHVSGEPIAWEEGPTEPVRIDAAQLRRLAGHLAAATLLKRRAPELLEGYLAAPDVVPDGMSALPRLWPTDYVPVLRRFLGLASPEPQRRIVSPAASALFAEALDAYNADHTRDWGRAGGSCCPVCCGEGGCACFGRSKHKETRWSCFNTDHPDGCGHKADDGTYHSGDALDLDAFARGRTTAEHLRAEGYLADRSTATSAAPREEPPMVTDDDAPIELRGHLSLVPSGREPGCDDGDEENHKGAAGTEYLNGKIGKEWNHSRPDGAPGPKPADPDLAKALADIRARRGTGDRNRRFKVICATDLLEMDLPRPVWLVDGLVPAEGVVAIAGEPKSIKTWLMLTTMVCIATGTPVLSIYQVRSPGTVVIFCVEDDARAIRNRLRAIARGLSLSRTDLSQVHVIVREHLDLSDETSVAALVIAARSVPGPVVALALDPLRDIHSADENDSTGMAVVTSALRVLRDVLSSAVSVNHHVAKRTKDTADRRPGQRMRGSSAVHGAIDAGIYLTDLETDGQSWWETTLISEVRSARGAGSFRLRLDVEDDAEGEAVCARWSILAPENADAAPAGPTDGELLRETCAAVMRVLTEVPEGGRLSERAIRASAGCSYGAVTGALRALEGARKIQRVWQKTKAVGWQICPDERSERSDGEEKSDEH